MTTITTTAPRPAAASAPATAPSPLLVGSYVLSGATWSGAMGIFVARELLTHPNGSLRRAPAAAVIAGTAALGGGLMAAGAQLGPTAAATIAGAGIVGGALGGVIAGPSLGASRAKGLGLGALLAGGVMAPVLVSSLGWPAS